MSNKNKRGLYPIAVLINGLTDEDVNCRINSMKRLVDIAKALGEDRTRNELIPFITETCTDDEDELLNVFAEQMGEFLPLIGGSKHVHVLIKPLEILCKVEESSVRNHSVSSIGKLLEILSQENQKSIIQKHFFPLVKRLAENKWYTSRSSASGVIPLVYLETNSDNQTHLRTVFSKLCKDKVPMVRRYAAKNLGNLAKLYDKDFVIGKKEKENSLLTLFDFLRKDDQDSVRLLAVLNTISLSKVLSEKENMSIIIPVIKMLGKDRSWRVRYMIADKFSQFCSTIGSQTTQVELVSLFSNLCLDKEAEVRTAGAFQIAGVCALLTKEQVVSQILPTIKRLVKDSNAHVRAALASVIMSLSSILGKDSTIKYLLEHFLSLLKDDFSEVRLNIISKLSDVNSVIGAELLSGSGLMPSICELAEDKQWRVRLSVIQYIPLLAKQLGKTYFNEKLRKLCIAWLSDSVYSIRTAAAENIKELTKIFGEDWTKEKIIPEALKLKEYSNYLYRMVVLFLITDLSNIVSNDTIMELLPTVLLMADDPVPNIRYNVSKTLLELAPKLDKTTIQKKIIPVLIKLEKDTDADVKESAERALKKVKDM